VEIAVRRDNVSNGSKADLPAPLADFRFTPESGHRVKIEPKLPVAKGE
jgi:hypothetical protein